MTAWVDFAGWVVAGSIVMVASCAYGLWRLDRPRRTDLGPLRLSEQRRALLAREAARTNPPYPERRSHDTRRVWR